MTTPSIDRAWLATCDQAHARYREFMTGKRVVIVGPAASLQWRNLGAEFDSYDVIVRTNLSSPVPAGMVADVGSRTDVLYHVLFSGRLARAAQQQHTREQAIGWAHDGVQFLVTRQDPLNGRVAKVRRFLRDRIPMVCIPTPIKDEVRAATDTNPNTGVSAIAHLLSLPIKSLHIAGFDFYESGWQVGYGGFDEARAAHVGARGAWGASENVPHEQEGQKRYVAKLARSDKRVTLDDVTAEVLGLIDRPPPVTALVPIRGTSERVPGKNVRDLCGKPLLFWTLQALHRSRRVTRVVVDTDSDAIELMVKELHPDTIVIRRPENLHGGMVTGNPLTEWALTQLDGDHFLQTHVTNPLLTPRTIDAAIDAYFASDVHDSLFAVTEHQFRLYDSDVQPVNHDPTVLARSQDLEPLYEDNSNLYVFSRESFTRSGRIGVCPQMFEMSKSEAVDIDWPDDFIIAEALMARRLTQ